MNKKTIKYLSLIIIIIFSLNITSCDVKNKDFTSYSDDLNSQTFLKTDWGMSIDETLKALNLSINDIEVHVWDTSMDINKQYYKVKEKISVNGLPSTIVLSFYDGPISSVPMINSISTYRNIDKTYKDNYVGLVEVYVFPDETDKNLIIQSFKKELGDAKENNVGFITNPSAYLYKCPNIDLIENYLNIFKGSIFERALNQNENMYLSQIKLQNYPSIDSNNYLIIYSGLEMAFLNNYNRKVSQVSDSKMKEILIEKDPMPKNKKSILEQIKENSK